MKNLVLLRARIGPEGVDSPPLKLPKRGSKLEMRSFQTHFSLSKWAQTRGKLRFVRGSEIKIQKTFKKPLTESQTPPR